MANIPGEIVWQANDNTWFTNNAAEVYPAGITIYHVDGRYKFTDGVTTLGALPFMGDSSSIGVQSVTGPNVDNTDPANPVVNPLGLIKIVDLNGEFFTDLATAQAYIRTHIDANSYSITDESYNRNVYYFTVPQATLCILSEQFLGNISAPTYTYIEDNLGLITQYGDKAFYNNYGNNIFLDIEFVISSGVALNTPFRFFGGQNICRNLLLTNTNWFASNGVVNSKFTINGNIGLSEGANYSNFFLGSTSSTILATAPKYTSNSGAIQGDLQTAISNGCNVQFDGINLIETSEWIDISGSVSVTGFSGTPTKSVWYKITDGMAQIIYNLSGTSDTNNLIVAGMPFTVSANQPQNYTSVRVTNNGTPQTTPGRVRMDAGFSQFIIQRDMAGATFIIGGTKASDGQFKVML